MLVGVDVAHDAVAGVVAVLERLAVEDDLRLALRRALVHGQAGEDEVVKAAHLLVDVVSEMVDGLLCNV